MHSIRCNRRVPDLPNGVEEGVPPTPKPAMERVPTIPGGDVHNMIGLTPNVTSRRGFEQSPTAENNSQMLAFWGCSLIDAMPP